jgi:general secretion pathway protein J
MKRMMKVWQNKRGPTQGMHENLGFTLIEMLVVLVILALVTSLLIQSFSTTWRSFERLSMQDLAIKVARLPASWFTHSVAGAVLYHPDTPLFIGSRDRLEFVTSDAPDDGEHIPQHLVWRIDYQNINAQDARWVLVFESQLGLQSRIVMTFEQEPHFEYWNGQHWVMDYRPAQGLLPGAVKIVQNDEVWALAKPLRPVFADIPPELAQFGAYEF